jgi:hypothetical protein
VDSRTGKGQTVNEVIIRLDANYYVKFERDGAGIVVTVLNSNGEKLAWDRMSNNGVEWLREILS